MAKVEEIEKIKNRIEEMIGEQVTIKSKKRRNKIAVKYATIEGAYPSLFVAKIKDKYNKDRILSYSYIDILIKNVQISPCEDKQKINDMVI